jgi:hypothetical protein
MQLENTEHYLTEVQNFPNLTWPKVISNRKNPFVAELPNPHRFLIIKFQSKFQFESCLNFKWGSNLLVQISQIP